MKTQFTVGRKVRFNIDGGALAHIRRYLGEGFYLIKTVPDQRELVANEDDLALGWRDREDSEDGEDNDNE
jgi:hypothetical protein